MLTPPSVFDICPTLPATIGSDDKTPVIVLLTGRAVPREHEMVNQLPLENSPWLNITCSNVLIISHAQIAIKKPMSASLKIPLALPMLPGLVAEVMYKKPAYANNAAAIGIAIPIANVIIFCINCAKLQAWQPVDDDAPLAPLESNALYPQGTKPLLAVVD